MQAHPDISHYSPSSPVLSLHPHCPTLPFTKPSSSPPTTSNHHPTKLPPTLPLQPHIHPHYTPTNIHHKPNTPTNFPSNHIRLTPHKSIINPNRPLILTNHKSPPTSSRIQPSSTTRIQPTSTSSTSIRQPAPTTSPSHHQSDKHYTMPPSPDYSNFLTLPNNTTSYTSNS